MDGNLYRCIARIMTLLPHKIGLLSLSGGFGSRGFSFRLPDVPSYVIQSRDLRCPRSEVMAIAARSRAVEVAVESSFDTSSQMKRLAHHRLGEKDGWPTHQSLARINRKPLHVVPLLLSFYPSQCNVP
jgi:hypothetical protein